MYGKPFFLEGPVGNNALSWRAGRKLRVAPRVDGALSDARPAVSGAAFAQGAPGAEKSFPGLENFVRFRTGAGVPAVVFDNHNHALYFWYEARAAGFLPAGTALVHADEHSDLGASPGPLAPDAGLREAFEYANFRCQVGNFVKPCLENGFFPSFSWVAGGVSARAALAWLAGEPRAGFPEPGSPFCLDFDADLFMPEVDGPDRELKMRAVRALARRASFVTAATSPYFIGQGPALAAIREALD